MFSSLSVCSCCLLPSLFGLIWDALKDSLTRLTTPQQQHRWACCQPGCFEHVLYVAALFTPVMGQICGCSCKENELFTGNEHWRSAPSAVWGKYLWKTNFQYKFFSYGLKLASTGHIYFWPTKVKYTCANRHGMWLCPLYYFFYPYYHFFVLLYMYFFISTLSAMKAAV